MVALLGVVALAACSRTSDDPRAAYQAVFGKSIPDGVTVKQAQFWESRHLLVFYEYQSYLELEIDEPVLEEAMRSLGVRLEPFDATRFGFGSAPPWFAPRDGSTYLGWRSTDDLGITIIRSSRTKRVFALRSAL